MTQAVTGVIDALGHPKWGVLTRETGALVGPGPVTTSLTRVRGPVNVDAYGFSWSVFTLPAAWGYELGVTRTFEPKIGEWALLFTDLGGHTFYEEVVPIRNEGIYVLLNNLIPTSLDVYVAPGVVLQFYWLVAL